MSHEAILTLGLLSAWVGSIGLAFIAGWWSRGYVTLTIRPTYESPDRIRVKWEEA